MKSAVIIGICLSAACAFSAGTEVKTPVSGPAAHAPAVIPSAKEVVFPEQAALYQVLGLLEQNRTDEAAALFDTVRKTDDIFSPMKEYLYARLAFERGLYTESLQHLALVETSNSRSSEWLPASVFLEGMVYKKTGQAKAAAYAAEELMLGWPESEWSRRAAEFK